MKLLKNLGWFLLALLSFLFIYGFIQVLATTSLALGHFPGDVQQFFVYFSLGFSLGLAYISRKGLVYSISLHALNNLVGFLMILML